MSHRTLRIALATVGVALLGTAAVAGASATTSRHHATSSCAKVKVTGKVAHKLKLRTDDLRKYPVHEMDVTFQAGTTPQSHHYVGALLTDVLAAAQPRTDAAIKNDSLRFYAEAIGADKYAAIVSFGEIDPNFGNTPVLLAYDEDGVDLCTAGPRLVVPGDVKGGRYVSNVVRIAVGRAGGHH